MASLLTEVGAWHAGRNAMYATWHVAEVSVYIYIDIICMSI